MAEGSTDRITQPTDADVTAYLDGVTDERRRERHPRRGRPDPRGHRRRAADVGHVGDRLRYASPTEPPTARSASGSPWAWRRARPR